MEEDCKITLNKATTESLIRNASVLEYIDTSEAETMILAHSSLKPEEYQANRVTHMEIHPSLILSIMANQIIKKEWTDYNNHMNMAYYVLVFDQIWEIMLEKFKMGENSAKTNKMSTMVVETHTTYNNEVKEGNEVEINLTFFDHDKKRLHFKMEMIEKSSRKLSATLEMLSLYIDLNKRKVVLSIKLLEEIEKKEALEKYGSEGSGKNLPFSSLSEDLKKKEEEKE